MSELIVGTDTPNDGREKINEELYQVQHALGQGSIVDGRDNRLAMQDTLNRGATSSYNRTAYYGPGDYQLKSKEGTGSRTSTLLLENVHGMHIGGHPKSRWLVDGNTHGRCFVIRNCSDITLEDLTLIDISTRTASTGINIENSSGITLRNVKISGFGSYAIGITESSDAQAVTSSAIGFQGSEIYGNPGMFSAFTLPCEILITNSALNNGRYHGVSKAGDGHAIYIEETLVTELPGTSYDVLTNNTFSMNGTVLSVVTADLRFLDANDSILLENCAQTGNNKVWNVLSVDVNDGLTLNIEGGTFVTESAGANITLTRVGKAMVRELRATPCDNILAEHCYLSDIGRIGIEDFPKTVSQDHRFLNNIIEYCGLFITSGTGMKPGQATINTLVQGNVIRGCQMGISPGAMGVIQIHDNQIINCQKYGIAISMSAHRLGLGTEVPYTLTEIHRNLLTYTIDERTTLFYQTPYPGYPAINMNGLTTAIGGMDIADNTIVKWGAFSSGYGTGGMQLNKSFVPYENIRIRGNRIIDSGGFNTNVLRYVCRTTAGDPILRNFYNTVTCRAGPNGLYPGTQIIGPGIDPTARIKSMNYATGEVTMTLPSTITSTATIDLLATCGQTFTNSVAIRSGIPKEMLVEDNTFHSTNLSGTGVVQFYSDGGVFRRNLIRGFGPYATQFLGTTMFIDNNNYKDNNPPTPTNPGGVAGRGPILIGVNGDPAPYGHYIVTNNKVDQGVGLAQYIVNAANVGSWYASNNIALQPTVGPYYSGSVVPQPAFWWEGAKLIMMGTAPPTTGQNATGYEIRNINQGRTGIRGWICVASGNPGTWISMASVGTGDTGQRVALTANDRTFYHNTQTGNLEFWNGTTWKVIMSVA